MIIENDKKIFSLWAAIIKFILLCKVLHSKIAAFCLFRSEVFDLVRQRSVLTLS